MAFEEMTCPNCGAALEFKTGTPVIVCKFCNTTLRLKAEASNGHAAEYAAAVRHLFALGQ